MALPARTGIEFYFFRDVILKITTTSSTNTRNEMITNEFPGRSNNNVILIAFFFTVDITLDDRFLLCI